jgi:hypothetical protein
MSNNNLKTQFYQDFKEFIFDYLTEEQDNVIALYIARKFIKKYEKPLLRAAKKILKQTNEGYDELLIPDCIWLDNYAIEESGLEDEIDEIKEQISQL